MHMVLHVVSHTLRHVQRLVSKDTTLLTIRNFAFVFHPLQVKKKTEKISPTIILIKQ